MSQPAASDAAQGLLPASHVAELLNGMTKALRAFQMYLPNNPIYQRAVQNLNAAFQPIWRATDQLVFRIVETDIVWEEQVVYSQLTKSESLAWTLYKDGMRVLTLRRGVENGELAQFLELVNRARFLPADAGDDLLTLVWERDFESIQYVFTEPFGDAVLPEAAASTPAEVGAEERRAAVEEEVPQKPSGVVDLEDFDSTLYFLDDTEIAYILREVEAEYSRDVRGSALDVLFDLFELQQDPVIRDEIVEILDVLVPSLLNAGQFAAAAQVLRESGVLAGRAAGVDDTMRTRLGRLREALSQPEIVRQLVQSLDEGVLSRQDANVVLLLRELQPAALETLLMRLPQVQRAEVRSLLEEAADRMASSNVQEVLRLLRRHDAESLPAVVALCGRLGIQGAVPGLGELLGHAEPAIRLAAVTALAQVGSPGALAHVDRAIEDPDRSVRLAAVRAAGARGYKGALRRVEAVVKGGSMNDLDLTEKMAFFEAYAAIAGPAAVEWLAGLLTPRGLLRRREPAETRACAAMALGRVGDAAALEALRRAGDEKDPMVRNAVNKALREGGA